MINREEVVAPVVGPAVSSLKTATASGMATVPVGWWVWLGDNNSEIGAMCALLGASCAVISLAVGIWRGRR